MIQDIRAILGLTVFIQCLGGYQHLYVEPSVLRRIGIAYHMKKVYGESLVILFLLYMNRIVQAQITINNKINYKIEKFADKINKLP